MRSLLASASEHLIIGSAKHLLTRIVIMQTDATNTTPDNKISSFGARLKTAREAMGLERKDIAAQLRLNEKYLVMMEKDRFAPDLPLTFVRGYLKTYAKFLQIPEYETKKALDSIKPRPSGAEVLPFKNMPKSTTGNYFVQLFSYLIIFGLIGVGGAWWYEHPNGPSELFALAAANFNKAKAPSASKPLAEPAAPVITPQETAAATTTTNGIQEISTTNGANINDPNNGMQATARPSEVPVGADIDKAIDKTISAHIQTKTHAANTKPAYMNDTDDSTINVDDGTTTTTNDTD